MILSDANIKCLCEGGNSYTLHLRNYEAIHVRKPLIQPFIAESRKEHGVSHGLSCAGYDCRLGNEFLVAKPTSEIIDPATFATDLQLHKRVFTKYIAETYVIYPGEFILAKAAEYYCMPNNVTGYVKDKSTFARLGIFLQNTVLEPGWEGEITLEITNNSPNPVKLYAGMGIAQIVFHLMMEEPELAYNKRNGGKGGKYQGQTGVTLPRN